MKEIKLSKTSISGLGGLLSLAVLLGAFFLGISPLMERTDSAEMELQTAEGLTVAKTFNLQNLQQGAVDIDNAQSTVDNYENIIADSVDIESASRAISSAQTSGVDIVSFTFGNPEPIEPREEPTASLDSFASPFETSGEVTEDTSEDGETAEGEGNTTTGVQRVPVIISADANNQSSLTEYVNQLSQQDRLIFVTAIDSTVSERTTATIYGYAFFENS